MSFTCVLKICVLQPNFNPVYANWDYSTEVNGILGRHPLSKEVSRNGGSPGGCHCLKDWLRHSSTMEVMLHGTTREEKQAVWWAIGKVQSSYQVIPLSVSSSCSSDITPLQHPALH